MARPTDQDILALTRVNLVTTARYLGVSDETVADGLQTGLYPFGTAIQRPSGSWVYDIRPQALVEYNRCGRINLDRIAEAIADKVINRLFNAFTGGKSNGNNNN